MKSGFVALLILGGCSSGGSTPEGACRASDPTCNPTMTASDSGNAPEASAGDAHTGSPAAVDASADASCTGLYVDDAGVTRGCSTGGMGPGDQDDGGGIVAAPPDAALDASHLGFGASCWDNAQCFSDLCFDYKVRGTFCTQVCTTDGDCPSGAAGCNGMGVCRLPNAPDGG